MPYTLVAGGDASSLANLGQYENRFGEGDYGRLDLELKSSIAADIIAWLSDKLDDAGVPERRIVVSGKIIQIHFKKEIAPLVIIAAAIAASIIIFTLIASWQLLRLTPTGAAVTIFGIPLLVIAIVVGAIILIVYIGGRIQAGAVTIGK